MLDEIRMFPALIRRTWDRWRHADTAALAAAMAYNAVLSVAPLLLIAVTVAARLLGTRADAMQQVLASVERLAGSDAVPIARALIDMISQARRGLLATAFGFVVVIFFASGALLQFRAALNSVWGLRRPPGLGRAMLRRLWSLLVVPVAVSVFLIGLLMNFLGSAARPIVHAILPQGGPLLGLANLGVTFVLITVLLALAFRHGPRVPLTWRDVAGGSLLTAVLFMIGNYLIGHFIRSSLLLSLYGTAGAVVVVLLWVYYAAQILFFGAHYTRVYAETQGSRRSRPR